MESGRTKRSRTAVMGAGNLLMGDDGIGVHVIQHLRSENELPEGVRLIDAGTAALDVFPLLDDIAVLIIIDAVKGGGEPGTIYRFTPDEITETTVDQISLHQMSLLQALKVGKMSGRESPEVIIVGVEPKTISPGTTLSPELSGALPAIVEAIKQLV